ncbi:E3 ubiquitin-protein ligase RLIM-like [Alosa sapidissima]|uniref:E3 ubiquitin-protein ligase RLIM-like n=1 Tax=Alosa sapidissima TaxID=34773 RepID=UPI001C08B916|nr:E3 ubiquitin-protein ligase RLIM-like [Alosa sapidissima]
MSNRGRSRKRKRSSQQSRPVVQPNSRYYLLRSQEGDSLQPGPSVSHHTDLEQQLRADPLFLLRGNVVVSDDEDSRRSKRSRPIESSMPTNGRRFPPPGTSMLTNGRRSPQPGTSRDLHAHSELQQRARSPSPPRAAIPIATISDGEDTALPSVTRANTPPIMSDDVDDQVEHEDVIFVGVLHPPQIELRFHLVHQLEIIWETDYDLPINATYDLPTMIFNPENANGQSDCRICLSEYVEGEDLTILPCNHNFHSSCVNEWLQQSPTCPMCRTQIH